MIGRELLHLYGPLSINTYGTCIALSLLLFLWLIDIHPLRKKWYAHVDLLQTTAIGILCGIIGGRLLFVLSNSESITSAYDIINPCVGGYSILGAIIGILTCLPWYLHMQHIAVVPFFDLIAIHAPLLQALSRVGCFFAGCCYGKPTDATWGFVYRTTDSFAPCNISLHPTQLYSSIFLFIIFCFMYFFAQHVYKKPGQLISLYLLLISTERFVVDIWRDDQEFFINSAYLSLSINQWISVGIACMAISGFIYCSIFNQKNRTI